MQPFRAHHRRSAEVRRQSTPANNRLDELNTYVFDVAPKKIEKNQRYFQGRIWVDEKDFGIVKTDGKAVPDIQKQRQENIFSAFRNVSAKISKANTGFRPTRTPTTLCNSAAVAFAFA